MVNDALRAGVHVPAEARAGGGNLLFYCGIVVAVNADAIRDCLRVRPCA
jgi:hypothetical protein